MNMARYIKLFLAILFFIKEKIKLGFTSLLGKDSPGILVILYYHSVLPEERENFAKQMDSLKNLTIPIDLRSDTELKPNKVYSAVTFDDGFKNNLTIALPELEKRNIPFTIFFTTKNFGEKPKWEYNPVTQDKYEDIMTINEMRSLPSELVAIGSHTVSHAKLCLADTNKLEYEIVESKKTLEDLLNTEITLFSFPNGSISEEAIQTALKSGYKKLSTIEPYVHKDSSKEYLFGTLQTSPPESTLESKLPLLGYFHWLGITSRLIRALNFI